MLIREASISDIGEIQLVRNSVRENTLSDPTLVTNEDCADYLTNRGKGWVCVVEGQIVGFAIVSIQDHNVWALFLMPEFEMRGIGRRLHDRMIDWYFSQTEADLWLSTSPNTRAEKFYRAAGWKHTGMHGKEFKFEMSHSHWKKLKSL